MAISSPEGVISKGDVRRLFGLVDARPPAFDTGGVRFLALLTGLALAAGVLGVAGAQAAAPPTLRIVPGPSLVVAGTGFVPQTVVVVRVGGPDAARVARVRSGRTGRIRAAFPGLTTCSASAVTARGVRDRFARVPVAWFVRECPPPPPLAPGPTLG
jgi:hypothetical protein